jgi:hypothetical protein
MTERPKSRLWHKQTNPTEAALIACQIADVQDKINEPRRTQSNKHAGMFEGVALAGLDGDCFDSLDPINFDGAPLVNNRAASVVETLQSKLAALDEPRPQFVVTDGSYEQKRQAVWLDRFVEGQYYQPQCGGMYSNLWAMWRHAFLIAAAATGSVAVKVFPDFHARKIRAELHNTLDMWVDPFECRYSGPLSYGESTWFDAEMLCDKYSRSQKKTQAILTAAEAPKARNGKDNKHDNLQVRVHEMWRVRTDADKPGKYIQCVGNEALEFDDYEYQTPPFALYHFRRRIGGFWGASAVDRFYYSVVRENQVLHRMDEAEARSNTVIQYYDPGAVGAGKLSVPAHIVLIPYNPELGAPPAPFVPQWYPQTAPELMRIHAQNTHDASGVAAMQTTGQAQAGLTAAVAIRTVLSLLNERLAPQQRDIVQAQAVDTAYLYARAAKELYDRFGAFDSVWYGKSFVKTLPGKDCLALPLELFTAQIHPVSEKKNSPEDRVQLAQELVSQGVITGGHWLGILQHMDTVSAMKQWAKVEAWCGKMFDRILYAPESDLTKPGFYLSPPKYADLDYMMALAVDQLLTAQIDEVPDARRQILLKFLGDLDRKIDQRDMKRAQMGLPPKGAPTPGGAPAPAPVPVPA